MSRLLRRTLLATAALALALPASGASAHAGLDVSVPSAGAVLGDGPEVIVLDFDEEVETTLGGVEVTTSEGERVETDDAVVSPADPSVVLVEGVPELSDGVYVVLWQVTSADGHPARGAFTFQVGAVGVGVDADALVAAALDGQSSPRTVTWTLGAARFLAFVGLCVVVGAVLFHSLSGAPAWGTRLRRAVVVGGVALGGGSLAVFLLQGAYLSAGGLGDALDPSLWGDVAGTRLGTAVLVRLALVVVVAVLLRRGVPSPVVWSATSLALVLTFSTIGHPSASSPAAVAIAVDAVHLAGVAVWLGGLVWLLLRVGSERDGQDVALFSRTATVVVPVIVVTGGWQTWNLVGSLDDITATTWGRTLLVKTAIVVALVTLGGVSRWLLRHDGAASVRRLVAAEVVIGAVVLGVTAGLVATPPTPPVETQVFSANLAQGGILADISITPGRVGANEVHVVLTPPGGALQPVESAEARIGLPAEDVPALPIPLTGDGPNHYVGEFQIPSAGDWRLEIVVTPNDGSTVVFTATVPIPG